MDLPPDLAEHFGRPQLSLYFHGAEPQSGQELVAHGSRALDRMLALLEQRSAFTLLRLPQRVQGGEELLGALRPLNASIRDLRVQEQAQWLFVFHWRITYRADDKRQELYSVAVDEDGRRVPLAGEPGAGRSRTRRAALDLAQLLADGEPPALERNEEGYVLPPKLPPLTHLTRLADTARRYAIYHADLRCVTHEAEILPRLHKSLNRLIGYYQQQIEEVYDSHDPDGEKRRVLEADLNRKIAEEVENHRLHVQVELIGYVALERPGRRAGDDGHRRQGCCARAYRAGSLQRGAAAAGLPCVWDRAGGSRHRPKRPSDLRQLYRAVPHVPGNRVCQVRHRELPRVRWPELRALRPYLLGLRRARLRRAHQPLPDVRRRGVPCLPDRVLGVRGAPVPQPSLCRQRGHNPGRGAVDLPQLCGAVPGLPAVFGADGNVRRQRAAFLPQLPGHLRRLRAQCRTGLLCHQPYRPQAVLPGVPA